MIVTLRQVVLVQDILVLVANEQYRVDQVTVSMRLISVQTGEILLTQNVTKTIASFSSSGDVFTFLDMGMGMYLKSSSWQ